MTTTPDTVCQDAARFVERFEAFWAAPDPDALSDLLHPDAHLVQPMMPEMHEAAAFAGQLRRLLRFVPDLTSRVQRWAATADGVLIEHTMTATAAGTRIEWAVCDRITLRDGKATERIAYFDPTPLLRTLATRPRTWLPYLRATLGR